MLEQGAMENKDDNQTTQSDVERTKKDEYSTVQRKQIYFVSGHLDLSEEEFELHYRKQIDEAIKNEAWFVVGDARGADKMTQAYLQKRATTNPALRARVTVPSHVVTSTKQFRQISDSGRL